MATTTIPGMTRANYAKTRYLAPDGSVVSIHNPIATARAALGAWYDIVHSSLQPSMQTGRLLSGVDGLRRIQLPGSRATRNQWARVDASGTWHAIGIQQYAMRMITTYELATLHPELGAELAQNPLPLDHIVEVLRAAPDFGQDVMVVLMHTLRGEHHVTHQRSVTHGDVTVELPLAQISVSSAEGYDLSDDLNRLTPLGDHGAAILAYANENVILIGIDAGPSIFNTAEPLAGRQAWRILARDIRDAIATYAQFYVAEHAPREPERTAATPTDAIAASVTPRLRTTLTDALRRAEERTESLRVQAARANQAMAAHACIVREISDALLPSLEGHVAAFMAQLNACTHASYRGVTLRPAPGSPEAPATTSQLLVDAGDVCVSVPGAAGSPPTSVAISIGLPIRCEAIRAADDHSFMMGLHFVPENAAVVGGDDALTVPIPCDERALALAQKWLSDPATALRIHIDTAHKAVTEYFARHPVTLA